MLLENLKTFPVFFVFILLVTSCQSNKPYQIAFSSARDGNWEIYLMKIDGSEPTNLTKYPSVDNHPSISPDGKQIAFVSSRNFDNEIYIINIDGSNLTQFSHHPSMDTFPAWSPDGKNIVFVSDRDKFNDNLYIQSIDKKTPVIQLTKDEGFDTHPTWSPDGKQIAFISDRSGINQIYTIDIKGQKLRQLTFDSLSKSHPSWSPNGKQIAFVVDGVEGIKTNNDIYILDLTKNNEIFQITTNTNWDSEPDWKDQDHLIFVSNRNSFFELYQISIKDKQIVQLTNNKFYDSEPKWH